MSMWPPPSLWLTSTDQCWLASLSSGAVRYLGSEGEVCQELREKLFFQRNLCYHAVDERIRLQEQKLWGIFPGPSGPKSLSSIEAAKVAA
jgi:hypothetical protein